MNTVFALWMMRSSVGWMLLWVNAPASARVRDPHTRMGGGGSVVAVLVGMIGVSHSVSVAGIGWVSFVNRHSTTATAIRDSIPRNIVISRLELKVYPGLVGLVGL